MNDVVDWHGPSSRLVLIGVLDTLAEIGYDGLTVTEIKARAGAHRLRSASRLPVDIDLLVGFLMAGLRADLADLADIPARANLQSPSPRSQAASA